MINHLTGFLNKCVLAFKRDNHLETWSSVKQKTPPPAALVFPVSRMTSFSVIIPYIKNTTQRVRCECSITCVPKPARRVLCRRTDADAAGLNRP